MNESNSLQINSKTAYFMVLLIVTFLLGRNILSGLRTGIINARFSSVSKKDQPFEYWILFTGNCVGFALCIYLFFIKLRAIM